MQLCTCHIFGAHAMDTSETLVDALGKLDDRRWRAETVGGWQVVLGRRQLVGVGQSVADDWQSVVVWSGVGRQLVDGWPQSAGGGQKGGRPEDSRWVDECLQKHVPA